MKTRLIAFSLLTVLSLSCEKFILEDSDEEYTISGHLYEGSGESPLANQAVYLEGFRRKSFGGSGEFTNLGSTVTDSEGYFSITYDQQFASSPQLGSGAYVELRTSEEAAGSVMSFPWNASLSRDFSQIDHSLVYVTANSTSLSDDDSVYISISLLIPDQEFIEPIYFESVARAYNVAKVNFGLLREGVELKSQVGSTWDHEEREGILAFGISLTDFEDAHLAFLNDSVPNDFNRIEFSQRGFPYTDTIKLNL